MDTIHVDNDQKAMDKHCIILIYGRAESSYKFIQTYVAGNKRAPSLLPQHSQRTTHTAPPSCHGGELMSISSPPDRLPPPSRRPPLHPPRGMLLSLSPRLQCLRACDVVLVPAVPLGPLAERLLRDMCVESCVRCEGPRRCSSSCSDTIFKVRQAGKVADLPGHQLYIGRRPRRPTRPGSASPVQ